MKCLKKIAIFSLVFFVSLFFIMPVQAKSTQTYSIIYDLQDANGNKLAQVKYKNKDFTSEIGSEIKVRTTYFDKKYMSQLEINILQEENKYLKKENKKVNGTSADFWKE